jgi:chromosome partitioning protein
VIARGTAAAPAEHEPPLLAARIGQRVIFADAAQTGWLVAELDAVGPAACQMSALALEFAGLVP